VSVPVPELSQTEERIVLLVAQGRSRQEIAAVVGLDTRTVDWHVAQGRSRGEIAAFVGLDVRTVDWHLTQANRKLEKASGLLDRVRGREQGRKS
jgi:DNA-binding CsgD family transcriptional regulator